jgi:diguanylate cyclase (GGDEF)-like protein/PAS domain S-box-containing protein
VDSATSANASAWATQSGNSCPITRSGYVLQSVVRGVAAASGDARHGSGRASRVTLGGMTNAKGSVRLPVQLWLAASAALTVTQFRYSGEPVGDGLYLAVAAGAVTAVWVGVARLRAPDRPVGMLLGAAVTVSSLGDFTSLTIGWRLGGEPDASAADVGWVASYGLLAAALLLLLRRGDRGRRRDIDGLIDVAAIFIAGMMVIWALAVAATVTDPSLPITVRMVWGIYPVLDLAVLALALRLLLRDRVVVALLVAVGVGLWLVADFAYLAIANPVSYNALLDVGWLWGMILISLGVLLGPTAPMGAGTASRASATDEPTLARVSMALWPLLVPSLIELQWFLRGQAATPEVTIPGTVLLVALAFLRMARLASRNRQARAALESQERYASALAANSSDAVVVVDARLRLTHAVPALPALPGVADGEMRGRDLLELVAPEDREEARAAVQRSLATAGQVFQFELRVLDEDGSRRWFAARVVNLLTDPYVQGIVINLHDISDQKRAEAELSHQAFHDALTGLANRALLRDRLHHALERRERTGVAPAVIFLDLDGFKAVNDRLGHDRGDEVLNEVAGRLLAAVGRGETVGRLGGDEFAVLIEQSGQPLAEAVATAEQVLQALREPVSVGPDRVTVTASVGIAVGDRNAESSDVIRDADVAMYRSKATGKNRWTVYKPGMRTAARERLDLEDAMRVGLERDEYRLLYQPIVDLTDHRVIGFEALVRWQHPTRHLLLPDQFVPLAEETGQIVPLGRWVLQTAIRTAVTWQQDRSGLTVAINLSARQLADPGLVRDVSNALGGAGLPPDRLLLEITETALVRDITAAGARLQRLRGLGVRLAIDDFGTGYSSLSYLRHFPIDILKIDRSFVQSIPERGEFPPVLRGMLELGRSLGFHTLAEGVEQDFQATRLRQQQCRFAQGHLFGRPMSAAEAGRLLTAPAPVGG